jgi:hypothetical protein
LAQKWLADMLDKVAESERGSASRAIRVFPNRAQAEAYAREWLRAK